MRILIVEDNVKLARFLKRVFSEEGYATDVCGSGEDALIQGRSGNYDGILLDWMIRGCDGVHVCRELRRVGSSVPILMVSARSEVADRVHALNSGADDYLVKPFEINELLARVTALLRRADRPRLLCVGALQVDVMKRKATLAGKHLDLSVRELDLLVQLALNAEHPVSREALLREIWRAPSQSNLVDVHISRLRDKLDGYAWMIETIRGSGYRLRSVRGDDGATV